MRLTGRACGHALWNLAEEAAKTREAACARGVKDLPGGGAGQLYE